MKRRKARSRRRGRIEIIPMIDVMFFLLATFMLASLSMQNLHSLPVNLPKGRAAPLQTQKAITLTVTKAGNLLLDKTAVTLDTLTTTLKSMMRSPDEKIVVAADSEAPNGIVVQAMLKARDAGNGRFIIAVSPK